MSEEFVDLSSERAALVVPHASLQDVVLVESHCRVTGQRPSHSIRFDLQPATVVWGQRPDGIWAAAFPFAIRLLGRDSEESTDEQEFGSLRVVLIALYEVRDTLPDDAKSALPHYFGVSGTMHVWPFLRAEVQRATTSLRVPPLTLPVIVSDAARKLTRITAEPTAETSPAT